MQNDTHNYKDSSFPKYPTFRAKGVVKEITTFKNKDKIFSAALLDIGGYEYEIPISKNVREGDVIELKLNVIKVNR